MTGPRQAADRPDLTYTPALYRIFFPKTRHIAPEKPYIPHRETRNKKIHKSKFIRIISKMIIPILAVMLSWLSVTAQDITKERQAHGASHTSMMSRTDTFLTTRHIR